MARVPYPDPEDLPEQYRDLVVSSLQPGKTVNVYRAVSNNPPVLEGLRAFLGSLWTESGLSDRERELVILAVARHLDNRYEWQQHVNVARSIGIGDEAIAAVGTGDLDAFDAHEASLIRYARAVVDGAVDDETHASVAADLDDATLVGAASLAAGYGGLARIIAAVAVDLEDDFVGWEPSGE